MKNIFKRISKQRKKNLVLIFAVSIGLFCLYQVFVTYNWQNIGETLQKSNFYLFCLGSIISIISYWFFRALRWRFLLSNEDLQISFAKIYLITAVSVGLSTITPFQSGEALKVEYLKKYGANRFSGYGIFILERFQDLLVVVSLGIVGVSLSFNWQTLQNYLYLFAIALLLSGMLLVLGVFWLPFLWLQPLRDLVKAKWQSKYTLLSTFFLTFLSWMAVAGGWHFALKSVSIEVDFVESIAIVALTTLLSILSFVPGAIGVSELSISSILVKLGTPQTLAQTGAIAIRLYALMILLLTLLHWLFLRFLSKKQDDLS